MWKVADENPFNRTYKKWPEDLSRYHNSINYYEFYIEANKIFVLMYFKNMQNLALFLVSIVIIQGVKVNNNYPTNSIVARNGKL